MITEINKHTTKKVLFIDSFVVFLNLSTSYSIVPYLLFTHDRYVNMLIIAFINCAYYLCRFKKPTIIKPDNLFIIYTLIQVVCFFSGFTTGTGGSSVIVYLLINATFYFCLCKLLQEYLKEFSVKKSLWLIFRGYITLVLVSIIGSILLFIMSKIGVDIYRHDVSTKYDLFYDNVVTFGSRYYYPFRIGIVNSSPDIRIPFFQEMGLITGLYHEPHCMTFMCFPAFFICLYYIRNKIGKIIFCLLFLFIILLEASTTNIISLLGCLIVLLFYAFKSSIKMTISLIVLFVTVVLFLYTYVDMSIFNFIIYKIQSGSTTYSLSTIDFALKPRTLLGTSFYNLGFIKSASNAESMDVGYLSFALNILFLIGCVFSMIKLYISKSSFKLYILLFATYFFFHSTKVAMVSYSLTMLIFVVFIIYKVSSIPDIELNNEKCN